MGDWQSGTGKAKKPAKGEYHPFHGGHLDLDPRGTLEDSLNTAQSSLTQGQRKLGDCLCHWWRVASKEKGLGRKSQVFMICSLWGQ